MEILENDVIDIDSRILDLIIDEENMNLIMDVNFTEFMKSKNIMNVIFGGSLLNQNS